MSRTQPLGASRGLSQRVVERSPAGARSRRGPCSPSRPSRGFVWSVLAAGAGTGWAAPAQCWRKIGSLCNRELELRNPCRELSSPDLLLQPEQSHTKAFSREAKIAALSLCPASRLLWARWHRPCAVTPSWQSPAAPSTATGQRLGSLWGRGQAAATADPAPPRLPQSFVSLGAVTARV